MTEVHVELEDLGGRTKMVLTHVGIPSRLARRGRMDDGTRQARRLHHRDRRAVAPGLDTTRSFQQYLNSADTEVRREWMEIDPIVLFNGRRLTPRRC